MSLHAPEDLQRIYEARFRETAEMRQAVWRALIQDFFQPLVRPADAVLDLGCGYGGFINQVRCGRKFAMDLNPDARKYLASDVELFLQDCSAKWAVGAESLDVVFSSNFFEHLPDKGCLGRTLDEAHRCLRAGGKLVAMGPNIRYLAGAYWDFWDHYLALSEKSLGEALVNRGFTLEKCLAKFMPYSMAPGRQYPLFFVRAYLRLPLAWRIFGKQFLVIARK
jgi:SAM-dependent methyltransferase